MILRPRTRQRIVGPAIQRLWNFHPEHIRDGPADGVPITITARPLDVAGTTDHEYFVHLVLGFESTLMTLIRSYISRHGYNSLTRTQIRNLPFFLFPTETGGLGEINQVKEGATTLARLTVDTVQSIFETSQSKRYTIENDLKKLMSKIRSSETGNLSPGFMHLVAIGEVDPELLIHAIDTVEFQLNKADLARISQLDSIEIMRSQVDSLNQELKSKKKRIKIQPAGENGFFWGMLFGTFGLIAGIIIATISKRRKK